MKLLPIFLLLFVLFEDSTYLYSQKYPIKYGKIEIRDTSITSYQGADAIILCDFGQYYFDGTVGVVYFNFKRHLRIKILTEAGLRFATQKIPFYDLKTGSVYPNNRTYQLRAQTINIGPKGKLIKMKVKPKYMVESKPDEEYNDTLTINFQNVKPGSIIEYEATIPTIEIVNPSPWIVQYDIPCLWSELRIVTPLEFNYAIKTYNMSNIDVAEYKGIPSSLSYPGHAMVYNANQFQFVKTNIPALPFSGNALSYNNNRMFLKFMLDYANKSFLFPRMNELLKATDPEYKYLNRSEKQTAFDYAGFVVYRKPSLAKMAKDLNKSDRFGIPLILNMGLKDTIKMLTEQLTNDDDKVMAIYHYVQNRTEWNGKYRMYVNSGIPLFMVKIADKFSKEPVKMNTSLQKVMRKHKGTNSEINAVLINMLRAAGYKAYPVITSTLNKCYLDTSFYNIHEFNHMIAAVQVNGREMLLDATKKGNGSILTSEVMNQFGIKVEMQNAEWIKIANPYKDLPIESAKQSTLAEPDKSTQQETGYY